MTTLKNRPQTALVVIDVQNGVVAGTHERDTVVAHIHEPVDKARLEHVPVVWVQHADEQLVRGSDDWQIVPELTPGDGEPLVQKGYPDSFEETTLESVLSGLGVGRLVVAHTNLYWASHTAPGRTAGTVETAEVDLGASRTGRS